MRCSSDSVFCDECPSEARQWTAGGEEENPGCIYHTLAWYEMRSPRLEGKPASNETLTERGPFDEGVSYSDRWSGREDSNLRPPGPEPGALPG